MWPWVITYASIWGRMNAHVPPILMFRGFLGFDHHSHVSICKSASNSQRRSGNEVDRSSQRATGKDEGLQRTRAWAPVPGESPSGTQLLLSNRKKTTGDVDVYFVCLFDFVPPLPRKKKRNPHKAICRTHSGSFTGAHQRLHLVEAKSRNGVGS